MNKNISGRHIHFLLISAAVLLGVMLLSPLAHAATLTFSQSSVNLGSGQNTSVTISGGSGSYYVSGNTNPNGVTIGISGTNMTLTANNGAANASITICDAVETTSCGTITTTANTSSNTSGSGITFTPGSLSMTVGSSQSVTISGNGPYFISAGANPSIASITLGTSTLTVTSAGDGTTSVTICQQSGGNCGTFSATIAGGASSNVYFSPNNPSVAVGQNLNVTISGSSGSYTLSNNSNPNQLNAGISGKTLTLTGREIGSAILNICSTTNICNFLTVTIAPGTTTTTPPATTATPTYTTPITTTVAPTNISSGFAVLLLNQIQSMEGQLTQFQNQLTQLKVALQALVSGKTGSTGTTTSGNFGSVVSSVTPGKYFFTIPLVLGDSGNEVTELQKRLISLGFLPAGSASGYFGSLTQQAVMKYQIARGLTPLGNVGPGTRAELNK